MRKMKEVSLQTSHVGVIPSLPLICAFAPEARLSSVTLNSAVFLVLAFMMALYPKLTCPRLAQLKARREGHGGGGRQV